ncbi:hypothetical protein [Acinetobacter lwoffii]|jgi:hypothetical protein|uniref:hypothetical protein n=1 Tax=Acinetobacter lwoffii TaxID=28090 RepID=UPI001FB2E58D|nr:hypothetical protein [Acinetobacter lwoffii]MCJ0928517.1 hypothetical protein [Acinetobacter lwoffii]MCO8085844.1 hypothetical protein [Acinetobacter lwoffii]
MKSKLMISMGAVILMSMSQFSLAAPAAEKVVRTDRISFYKTAKVNVTKPKRVQRSDHIRFTMPVMEQPSLQQKRVLRSDRIILNKTS